VLARILLKLCIHLLRTAPALELPPSRKFTKSLVSPSVLTPMPFTPRLSVASGPTSPGTSTPVTGFFANLFNWKPQTYVLRSLEGLAITRVECEKLLTKYTVVVEKEHEDLWKCWVQPHYGRLRVIMTGCYILLNLFRRQRASYPEGSQVQSRVFFDLRA
jgi:hypothetical protein